MYELDVTVAARILFKIQDFPSVPDVLSTVASKIKLKIIIYISMSRYYFGVNFYFTLKIKHFVQKN